MTASQKRDMIKVRKEISEYIKGVTVMKKILSMLLVISMCFTLGTLLAACEEAHEHEWNEGEITTAPTATADGVKTYTCKTCDETKTENVKARTEVSAAEWESALALNSEKFVWKMEMELQGTPYQTKISHTVTKNGDKMQAISISTYAIPGMDPVTQEESTYYAKEGDKYYSYVTDGETVEKKEIDKETYDSEMEGGISDIFRFEDFQYANGAYTAAEITVGEGESATKYANVTLKFVEGKLVALNYSQVEEGGIVVTQSTIAYDNVPAITLPTVPAQ